MILPYSASILKLEPNYKGNSIYSKHSYMAKLCLKERLIAR